MNTLTELGKRVIEAEKKRDQYKIKRDKLKDDVLAWAVTCKNLERENKALRLQAGTYFDEWQNANKRIEELESEIDDRNEWDLLKMEQEDI
ncbi:hypothetical protein KJJ36_01015 [Staphylococcus pseudoxylosus]|uniref:hypothetical protein n=1 Tax=Staphylococcus pseudoxylosus TaxID=2282419 RepID=UPI001F179E65|nr:hypothetical protein [Staphylococcus pseudoxylosus]MCE5000970.1 hypothetical protein [Staphylococcus pseudoxylosus]